MKIHCLLALVLAPFAATQTQLPIPTFGSTFASATATRGFCFQTPVAITITGLRVPDESGAGVQCVEVTALNGPPPAYPATASGGQVFYTRNVPSNFVIPCRIDFAAGSWIGILGACGTTTMNNSYSGAIGGQFPTTIDGQPVTLTQFMTQTNLNTAGGQPYSGLAQGLGQLGRIEVYYEAPPLRESVALPPFFQTNNSATSTRGFHFTTPVPIRIVGLRVPDESNHGLQNVEVKRLSAAPAVAPATSSGGEVLWATNVPSHEIIPCNLLFQAGETIAVLGACGTTTMRNSMATPAGPIASSIAGLPVTLTRLETASNVNGSQAQPYSSDPTGRIGRIEVYYKLAPGNATTQSYGSACAPASRGFYDYNTYGAYFGMNGRSIELSESGGAYTVSRVATSQYQPPPANAITLLTQSASGPGIQDASVTLSSPFLHFGTPVTTLHVCIHGFVSVAPGNPASNSVDIAAWLASPVARWGTWHGTHPTSLSPGHVRYHESGANSYVTWDMIRAGLGALTWQLELHRTNGRVTFSWVTTGPTDGAPYLVGYAPGGFAHDMGGLNLTTLAVGGPSYSCDPFDRDSLVLDTSARPRLATTIQMETSAITPGSLVGVTLLGTTPVNTPLDPLGAPQCTLLVDPLASDAFLATGTTASTPLMIPNNLLLIGTHVYAQSVTVTSGQNALNLLFSNGVDLRLDVL